MPYLFIENYEAGLDSRKSRYTAPAGTLREAVNCHINRGKEVETRKKFAAFATLPANTFGLHDVDGQLFVFGSAAAPTMPPTMQYSRLQATPSDAGAAMVKVWAAENFNSAAYVVAEFDNGAVHHFYDGSPVSDWETLAATYADASAVATALARRVEFNDGVAVDLKAKVNTVVLTGPAGSAFTVTPAVTGGAGTLSATTVQAAVPAAGETLATCSFTVTGGTDGPSFNTVASVTVDGVSVTGGSVDFDTDNDTTAAAVAARITGYAGTAHTATAVGAVVTITAPAGTGASVNGQVLAVGVSGDVTVGSVTNMASGADPVSAVAQITELTVTGYDGTTLYQVTVDGTLYQILGIYAFMPVVIRAFDDKMYAGTQSLVFFSGFADGLPDCTEWINQDPGPPVVIGAGFLNTATKDRGAERVMALGVYQDRLAVFARRGLQIWTVDPDPDQNGLYQSLRGVGAVAADSVVEYGDLDIFALNISGIRSLRARDSSNLASADDVGVSIDGEVTQYMRTLTPGQVFSAKGVIEPEETRYLLALGERVYVFSNFPGSRVSAWTTYVLGAEVDQWAATDSRLYARIGDQVLLYGGASGDEYDGVDVTVTLPFLDANAPGSTKEFHRIDLGIDGTWTVEIGSEPNDPDEWEEIGVFNRSTYGSEQKAGFQARSTHIALRFTATTEARSILGNALLHFEEVE